MNVELIKMSEEDAKEKLQGYKKRLRNLVQSEANKEVARQYKMAIDGYRALSKGTPLLDLEDVFSNCPVDQKLRPRLAIARADRKRIRLDLERDLYIFDSGGFYSIEVKFTPSRCVIRHKNPVPTQNLWGSHAQVPMVPPDKLPGVGKLSDYQILWEVEQWADGPTQVRPDKDPYLLKHIGGMLFAVIAEWDLTELERSIMKTRIN